MALIDNLISYWTLDEASGNRADSHSTNHLTDNNTVTQAAGKIGNAAEFTQANAEFLSCADNASLSLGDIDFSYSVWIYPYTVNSYMGIVTKDGAPGMLECRVDPTSQLTVIIRQLNQSDVVRFSPATVLIVNTWYHLLLIHDSVNNLAHFYINGVAETPIATTGVPHDNTSPFMIGNNAGFTEYFNGRIDEVGFWKRVLTSDERAQLYNAGAGLAYPFSSGPAVPVLLHHYQQQGMS